jgi:hypothetical protein
LSPLTNAELRGLIALSFQLHANRGGAAPASQPPAGSPGMRRYSGTPHQRRGARQYHVSRGPMPPVQEVSHRVSWCPSVHACVFGRARACQRTLLCMRRARPPLRACEPCSL